MAKYRFKTKEEFKAEGLWKEKLNCPENWASGGEMNKFLGQDVPEEYNKNCDSNHRFSGPGGWSYESKDYVLKTEPFPYKWAVKVDGPCTEKRYEQLSHWRNNHVKEKSPWTINGYIHSDGFHHCDLCSEYTQVSYADFLAEVYSKETGIVDNSAKIKDVLIEEAKKRYPIGTEVCNTNLQIGYTFEVIGTTFYEDIFGDLCIHCSSTKEGDSYTVYSKTLGEWAKITTAAKDLHFIVGKWYKHSDNDYLAKFLRYNDAFVASEYSMNVTGYFIIEYTFATYPIKKWIEATQEELDARLPEGHPDKTSKIIHPEYYEFTGHTSDSFTKGKIYKALHPSNLGILGNFIDNKGNTNGFGNANDNYFKPSTKEAFDKQKDSKSYEYCVCTTGNGLHYHNKVGTIYKIESYNKEEKELKLHGYSATIYGINFDKPTPGNSTDYALSTKEEYDAKGKVKSRTSVIKDDTGSMSSTKTIGMDRDVYIQVDNQLEADAVFSKLQLLGEPVFPTKLNFVKNLWNKIQYVDCYKGWVCYDKSSYGNRSLNIKDFLGHDVKIPSWSDEPCRLGTIIPQITVKKEKPLVEDVHSISVNLSTKKKSNKLKF